MSFDKTSVRQILSVHVHCSHNNINRHQVRVFERKEGSQYQQMVQRGERESEREKEMDGKLDIPEEIEARSQSIKMTAKKKIEQLGHRVPRRLE